MTRRALKNPFKVLMLNLIRCDPLKFIIGKNHQGFMHLHSSFQAKHLEEAGSSGYLVISLNYTKPGKGFSPSDRNKVCSAIQL